MNAAFDDANISAIRAAVRIGTHYRDANTTIELAPQLTPKAKASGLSISVG